MKEMNIPSSSLILIIALSYSVGDPSLILSSLVLTREAVIAKLSKSSVPILSSLMLNGTLMLVGPLGINSITRFSSVLEGNTLLICLVVSVLIIVIIN